MSKRRGVIAFALGLIFLASLGVGAWSIRSLEKHYSQERKDIAERYNSETHSGIEACREIPYIFAPAECINDAVGSSQEEYTAYKDLKAQQHMSLSALGVLIVSAMTMIITTTGVIFVWFTLKETAAGVLVMRNEQRPWVSIDVVSNGPLSWHEGSGRIILNFNLTNRGKQPAGRVCLEPTPIFPVGTFTARDRLKHIETSARRLRAWPLEIAQAIFPNQSMTIEHGISIDRKKIDDYYQELGEMSPGLVENGVQIKCHISPDCIAVVGYAWGDAFYYTYVWLGISRFDPDHPNVSLGMEDGKPLDAEQIAIHVHHGGVGEISAEDKREAE